MSQPRDSLSGAKLVYRKSNSSDGSFSFSLPNHPLSSPQQHSTHLPSNRRNSNANGDSRLSHRVAANTQRLSLESDHMLRTTDSEIKRAGEDEDRFVQRNKEHVSSTILPPATFFAPKRASERPGAVSPFGRKSRSPFFQLEAGQEEVSNKASERRAPSPWGLTASVHSIGSSAYPPSAHLDQQPSSVQDGEVPTIAIRGKASTDPLIPTKALQTSTPRQRPQSQSPNERNASSVAISIPATTSMPRKRRHAYHGGSNRFFLRGLIMTSDDNPLPFLASVALLLILGGLFFGFEAPWIVENISPVVIAVFSYFWLMTLINMLVTAWKDPGVIPRDLDPDPPCTLGKNRFSDPKDPLAIPVQRVVHVRGQEIQLKWCETCGTYRPPRSSHCRVCDNCVENIDHHCTFLNTCIGRRNYVPFMVFLAASIVAACMVIAFSAVHLVFLTKSASFTFPRGQVGPGKSFKEALGDSPVSAVLFLLSLGTLGPILVLFSYHVRLIALNRTTVEQIRISTAREYGEKRWDEEEGGWILKVLGWKREKDPNPFATSGMSRNVRNGLGWRSVGLQSWLDRRKWFQEDRRRPNPAIEVRRPEQAPGRD